MLTLTHTPDFLDFNVSPGSTSNVNSTNPGNRCKTVRWSIYFVLMCKCVILANSLTSQGHTCGCVYRKVSSWISGKDERKSKSFPLISSRLRLRSLAKTSGRRSNSSCSPCRMSSSKQTSESDRREIQCHNKAVTSDAGMPANPKRRGSTIVRSLWW
jgi:hypothetical protein